MTEKIFPPTERFLKYIWHRTHSYKMNWIQVIVGEPGAGKSYCALTLGEKLDPNFNIDKVCFTPTDFMTAIDKVKKKGEVVIFDEGALMLSSRKWQNPVNILINEVLQTFRYLNAIVFFCVPSFKFIDSQARALVNCFSEVQRRSNQSPVMRINRIQIAQKTEKIYWPRPMMVTSSGRVKRIDRMVFKRLPSPELRNQYEDKMKVFKDKVRAVNAKALAQYESIGEDGSPSAKTPYDYANEIVKRWDEFINIRGRLDKGLIMTGLNIGMIKAEQYKSLAENIAKKKGLL